MRRLYVYSFVLVLALGCAALFGVATPDDRDNKYLNDRLRQAAFDSISDRLVALGLPQDGLQQIRRGQLGQTDGFGYTPVEFLYVNAAQCIAFQARCIVANNVANCPVVDRYPYHEHQEDCPLPPDME